MTDPTFTEMQRCLVDGLAQAEADCWLPELSVTRDLRRFLDHDLDILVDPLSAHRLIAHPPMATIANTSTSATVSDHMPLSSAEEQEFLKTTRISPVLSALQYPSSEHIFHDQNLQRTLLPRVKTASPRVVVAIGPEGGWEPEEVLLFRAKGFHAVSLGQRILRTDIAVSV